MTLSIPVVTRRRHPSGGVVGPVLALTDQISDVNHSSASDYTWSGASFGAADPDRHLILAVNTVSSTANVSVSGVTIGGVVATLVVESSSFNVHSHIYRAAVPSGVTGDVVLSFSGSVLDFGVALFRAVHATGEPLDTASAEAGSPTSPMDLSLNTAASGGVIAARMTQNGAVAQPGPTGFTEHHNLDIHTGEFSYIGSLADTDAGTPLAVSMPTADGLRFKGVAASWAF